MKYLITAAATLAASPALGHGGPHMHPHGMETYFGLAFIAAILVGVTWAIARRRP